MSAQAILSMIAPALPATPQGPSVADASGFGDMLAHLLSTEAATSPAMVAAAPAEAAVAPIDVPGPSGDETLPSVEATGPPVGVAAPLVEETVPPVDEAAPDDEPASSAESEAGQPASPPVASPPVTLPPVVADAGGSLSPKARGDDLIAAIPTAPGPGPDPALEPGVVEADSPSPTEMTPAQGSGPQEAASNKASPALTPPGAAAASAPSTERAEAAAAQTSSPSPAPATATPPPLRALAERTSKPLDPAAQTPDSAMSIDAKPAGTSNTSPSPPAGPTDKPATPAAAAAAAPAAALDPGPTTAETGPAGDPVADRTEAAAPARDHSLSTLSRATVDATAQIAAQIQRKLEGRSTRFEIALRPDELGRVDVKLDIDAEGRLSARLAFDNPAAAADLRGRADELRRQLEAAGFHLAEDAFEFAERDSGSSAFDRGQDSRQGQNRAFAAAARLNADIDIAQPPQWLSRSLSPSGVDMKV